MLYGYLVLERFQLARARRRTRRARSSQRAIAERVRAEEVVVGMSRELGLRRRGLRDHHGHARGVRSVDQAADAPARSACSPMRAVTDTAPLPTRTRPNRVRWRYVVIAVLCVGAIVWMVVLLQKNVVFFKTVSQAVHDEPHDGTRTMRIGGGVVPGSIQAARRRRRLRRSPRAARDRARAPHRQRAVAVQGLRAGRRRRPLDRAGIRRRSTRRAC